MVSLPTATSECASSYIGEVRQSAENPEGSPEFIEGPRRDYVNQQIEND